MSEPLPCFDCSRLVQPYEAKEIPNGQGGVFVRGVEMVGPFCLACFSARLSPNPLPSPVAILAYRL
ncbi:hypothetical protein UFOVP813_38 [uncultured Caudovirales phage]|uniref:Uncharacterized protein n=1 Tax=uncultured Caudovirales phage TaxID=2100421 RepID=A0A6J5P7W1_9CAUD|nr:hypothetical protein UFOVP813_38 [uncultured Caudovirales phage]